MKTVTRNISLSEELDGFARQETATGGFSSLSEFFRDLLRQRRQAQIQQDVALLAQAITGAPEEEPGEPFFRKVAAAQRRTRL